MRLAIQIAVFACLAMATTAHATRTASIAAEFGLPVPGRGVGSDQPGVEVGVALQNMESPHVGVGVDVVYHYWPASPDYMAAFNRYLSSTYFETLDSPTYAFQAIQVSPHLRVLALPTRRWCPWLEGGAGVYMVDRNFTHANWAGAELRVITKNPDKYSLTPGWSLGVGCDVRSGARTTVGFDMMMHSLWSPTGPGHFGGGAGLAFTAITSGVHIQFGL